MVKNGYVEYEIEHCSEYILTQAKIIEEISKKDYKIIIIIIETFIIIGLTIYMLLKNLKNKKIDNQQKTVSELASYSFFTYKIFDKFKIL